jgi:glycosyltransferase involved in cell wall biosynthesis
VFTLRSFPDHRELTARRLRVRFIAEAVARCDAVCVQSGAAAAALRRSLGADSRVIAPGVHLSAFERLEPRAEQPTILCTADTDDRRTRVPLLLKAFERLRRDQPHARLQLVEPAVPADANRLRTAVPGLELLSPVADARELARAYSRAWVCVLPATGVSFPTSLVESLACGTPVVGSEHWAAAELVDRDAIGRLFDSDDSDLSAALLEAIELSQDESVAAACRGRAEDFPFERCLESYLALYDELLAG